MRWRGRQQSGNVEDRRGMGGKLALGGGAGGLIIVIISLLLGENPLDYINVGTSPAYEQQQQPTSEAEDQMAEFVKVVLNDTEDVWTKVFAERGETYQEPVLVLFSGGTRSGCGAA